MNFMKLLQWLAFITTWIGAGVLLFVYTDLFELLAPHPYLWSVVFIIAGIGSVISFRLARNIRK